MGESIRQIWVKDGVSDQFQRTHIDQTQHLVNGQGQRDEKKKKKKKKKKKSKKRSPDYVSDMQGGLRLITI